MATWTSEELNRIGTSEELRIAALRPDGTLRKSVIIWVVRVGNDLYVRSVKGHEGAWFRGVRARHEGRIQAGGLMRDVTFVEEPDPVINEQVDAAYRAKYDRYGPSIVGTIVSPEARSATIRLTPRQAV